MSSEPITYDAVVVGAGQAGLGSAKVLSDNGLSVVVLERGRIGETWISQRWDSFALNTPNWMNGLPGAPYDGGEPDGFMTHIELAESFEEYVRRFDIDVREGRNVTYVCRGSDGQFTVAASTSPGSAESYHAKCVVVASGILQSPRVPDLASGLPDWVMQRTSGTYRNPESLPEGAVMVVGGGQSGGQIVEDLLDGGREVYFAISDVARVPRRYRGRDFMEWFDVMGLWDVRSSEIEDPAALTVANPLVSGVGPLGHSLSFQYLAGLGAKILGRLERVEGDVIYTDDKVPEYLAHSDESSAELTAQIDEYISDNGIDAPPNEDDPGDGPVPDPEGFEFIEELDLEAAGVSTVIWSTGFSADFSWLDLPVLDDKGMPTHEDGISDVPGVYFIGFPWTSKRKSGVVYGIEEDALRITKDALALLRA